MEPQKFTPGQAVTPTTPLMSISERTGHVISMESPVKFGKIYHVCEYVNYNPNCGWILKLVEFPSRFCQERVLAPVVDDEQLAEDLREEVTVPFPEKQYEGQYY